VGGAGRAWPLSWLSSTAECSAPVTTSFRHRRRRPRTAPRGYNGHVYASEIAPGFDVFRLTPSEHLSPNEIDAAKLVRLAEFNPQHQPKLEGPTSFVVTRAYLDQLVRSGAIPMELADQLAGDLDRAEGFAEGLERHADTRAAFPGGWGAGGAGARRRAISGGARHP
jgi:hypothetical protein